MRVPDDSMNHDNGMSHDTGMSHDSGMTHDGSSHKRCCLATEAGPLKEASVK